MAEKRVTTIQGTSGTNYVAETENLTRYEWAGLENRYNLADGHARHAQTQSMEAVIDGLPGIYRDSEQRSQLALQRDFERAFYTMAGQHSVLTRPTPLLHHYSSSVSIEVVANYLRAHSLRLGLLHPTFDNIPGILRRHGVPLTEVPDDILACPSEPSHYKGIDALFLVVPNNPTGEDPEPDLLREIANQCRDRKILLIVDFSFRHFSDHLAQWDQYGYLDQSGVEYVGIEDTGKTWPTLDLKVGSLVASASVHDELQRTTDDLLLNVSPFIFALITAYIRHDADLNCVATSRRNRAVLEEVLRESPIELEAVTGPISVAWLRLPDHWRSSDLARYLAERGISILPGGPFFWNRPDLGEIYIRVALLRPPAAFASAAAALCQELRLYNPTGDHAGGLTLETSAQRSGLSTLVLAVVNEALDGASLTFEDDFFVGGGDSLTAMHVMARISKELGSKLRVRLIFENPELGSLVEAVRGALETEDRMVGSRNAEDPLQRLRRAVDKRVSTGEKV